MLHSLISESETSQSLVFFIFFQTHDLFTFDSDDGSHIGFEEGLLGVLFSVFDGADDLADGYILDGAVQVENTLVTGRKNRFVIRQSEHFEFGLDFVSGQTRFPQRTDDLASADVFVLQTFHFYLLYY